MGFYITENQFSLWLEKQQCDYDVYAPKHIVGGSRFSEADCVRYALIKTVGEIVLDEKSENSFKEVLMPISQTLFFFTENEVKEADPPKKGAIIFLRSCDLHALKRLDEMYMHNGPADYYYGRLRQHIKVVLIGCPHSFETCFCVSMGTNRSDNYDMSIDPEDCGYRINCNDAEWEAFFQTMECTPCDTKPAYINENTVQVHIPLNLDATVANASIADLQGEDFDVSLTGFDKQEIGLILGVDDEIVQDEVPEVAADAPTICQRGELWQLGRHRLFCGSSTDKNDVARLMDGQISKLLFTSPPYSDMREYNGGKDLSIESIVQFVSCYEPFAALQAVNLGIQRKDGEVYPYWDSYLAAAKSAGLKLLAWNVWDKLTCGSVGQQSAMIPIRHEWIFCFGKEPAPVNLTWRKKEASIYSGGRYNKIRQADGSFRIARRGNETGAFKKMESLLELPEQTSLESVTKQLSEKGKIRAEHPATFPVALPSEYIVAFTDESDIVVEPFGGAGTTLIACEQLNRTCYIMELDAHYCDVIIKRWENFTGRKAEKDGQKNV